MRYANRLVFAGLIVLLVSDANAQFPPPSGKVQVLTPEGNPAIGAKLFVGTSQTMSLIGAPTNVKPVGQTDFNPAPGSNQKVHRYGGVRVAIEQGEGIDVAELFESGFGEMDGEDLGGMDEMGAGGVQSAFYYAVHPEHGFAFVPWHTTPPKSIKLRAAGRFEVAVPKRYSPDQYVVLACWMNRYADPITVQSLRFNQEDDDMGMYMEDFGWTGAGLGPMYDATSGLDPLHHQVSDWRLRTMVTHWALGKIEPGEEQSYGNDATIVLPPGEIRLTLVPYTAVRESLGDVRKLQELLLFGGPTKILLTSESIPNSFQGTILPSEAVRDIELIGRVSGSGIPNWTPQENHLLLTGPAPTAKTITNVSSDQEVIQIAEQQREKRSTKFLGRIAHRIGPDRYLAIGLPVRQYYAWSVDAKRMPSLVSSVKLSDRERFERSLEKLSVRSVSPDELKLREKISTKQTQPKRANKNQLSIPVSRSGERIVYAISPVSNSDPGGRKLVDLSRPMKFKPRNPNDDPFAAKDPNQDVGVISESRLRQMQQPGPGVRQPPAGMNAPLPQPQPGAAPGARIDTAGKEERLDSLQRRIDKLEKDLDRAKQMLAALRKQ